MRKSSERRGSIAKVLSFYKKAAERADRALELARLNGTLGGAVFCGMKPPRKYH